MAGLLNGLLNSALGADNIRLITTAAGATHSVSAADDVILSTYSATNAVTITLTTAQTIAGRTVHVIDAGGLAGTNNITIDTEGSEKIIGQDTYVINSNYNSVSLVSDGSHWFVL